MLRCPGSIIVLEVLLSLLSWSTCITQMRSHMGRRRRGAHMPVLLLLLPPWHHHQECPSGGQASHELVNIRAAASSPSHYLYIYVSVCLVRRLQVNLKLKLKLSHHSCETCWFFTGILCISLASAQYKEVGHCVCKSGLKDNTTVYF